MNRYASSTPPQDVLDAAAMHDLGRHEVTFVPLRGVRPLASAVLILLLSSMFMLMLITIFQGFEQPQNPGMTGMCFALASVPVIMSVVWLWHGLRVSPILPAARRARQLYIFVDGFARREGRSIATYRWDEVLIVYDWCSQSEWAARPDGSGMQQHDFRLLLRDGRRVHLTTYMAWMADLAPLMLERIAQMQLPKAIARIEAGKTAAFGPFLVDRDSVMMPGGEPVRWRDVSIFSEQYPFLSLHRDGQFQPFARVHVGLLPNYWTFTALAQDRLRSVGNRIAHHHLAEHARP
jgi:hypothetical protein